MPRTELKIIVEGETLKTTIIKKIAAMLEEDLHATVQYEESRAREYEMIVASIPLKEKVS